MKNLIYRALAAEKKLFILLAVAVSLWGCSTLKAPQTTIGADLRNYPYAYIIPTSGVTSSSGVYGNQYGVYGGATKTINPSEVIAGNLMQRGYTILPELSPDLAAKTLIVSYGYTGRRQLSAFSYASSIIIQMRDAKTHKMVAECEAEGCGADETDDILQAIITALNNIYTTAHELNQHRIE